MRASLTKRAIVIYGANISHYRYIYWNTDNNINAERTAKERRHWHTHTSYDTFPFNERHSYTYEDHFIVVVVVVEVNFTLVTKQTIDLPSNGKEAKRHRFKQHRVIRMIRIIVTTMAIWYTRRKRERESFLANIFRKSVQFCRWMLRCIYDGDIDDGYKPNHNSLMVSCNFIE